MAKRFNLEIAVYFLICSFLFSQELDRRKRKLFYFYRFEVLIVISVECSTFDLFCKKKQKFLPLEMYNGVLCHLEFFGGICRISHIISIQSFSAFLVITKNFFRTQES